MVKKKKYSGDMAMERMILIEKDDDLAVCVSDYFQSRYLVSRFGSLSDAARYLNRDGAALLMADITSGIGKDEELLAKVRVRHKELCIVLTYLAPLATSFSEKSLQEHSDLLIRKPYRVMDVDSALHNLTRRRADSRDENYEEGLK